MTLVRPEEHPDPAAAVLAAHASGALLSLPTSATSGRGRRVLRSAASWTGSFGAYSALTGVDAGSRVWIPGPDSSTMVLFAAAHARAVGAVRTPDPAQASHACLTPAQLDRCARDLSAGCRVVVAGAPLLPRQHEAATALGLSVVHYYGAAELSFVAAGGSAYDLQPFERVHIEIREAPLPGTIWVRSPWLCDGYEGPAGGLLRDGPWASVGDLGRFEEGRLRVLGRPDAVTSAGRTVLVADVEAALAPAARGPIAVHALPHDILGQVVALTLVDPRDRAPLDAAARRLPATHRPRVWRLVPELPLTPAGKVDRLALGSAPGETARSAGDGGTARGPGDGDTSAFRAATASGDRP